MSAYDYEVCPQGLSTAYARCNLNIAFLDAHIKKLLRTSPSVKILELGSGGGRNLHEIHRRFGGSVELYGTDISASAIDYASSLGIGSFLVAGSDVNPFHQKFDLILMIDLLEHLGSTQVVVKTLDQATRSLSSGGCIYISVPVELNRYSLTWFFSKLPYFRDLTREFFGHTLRFDIPGFLQLINKKRVQVDDVFYSVHFINHIQMLFFFYIPKILIKFLLGKRLADSLRDSGEVARDGRPSWLVLLKTVFISLGYPLAWLSIKESSIRKHSVFSAGNMHLLLKKRES